MRRFIFTSDEIDMHKKVSKEWHNFIRHREAEMIFSLFTNKRFHRALELGAGNGAQSMTISKLCDKLICTEKEPESHAWLGKSILERKLQNVEYAICDAQDLSRFSDNTFDMIFSSNLLEHIPEIDICLKECWRVLKNDGLMLHTMPTRYWKFFNDSLNIIKIKSRKIHGVSKNHYKEFITFGSNSWKKKFKKHNFEVKEIVGLPFYVGHGNSFIPIIKLGNILNMSATYLYISCKN